MHEPLECPGSTCLFRLDVLRNSGVVRHEYVCLLSVKRYRCKMTVLDIIQANVPVGYFTQ